MARRLHQTAGLIISWRDVGESSRLFFILTQDFGLIPVLAQGVRELSSRLRYRAQSGHLLQLQLVRGREFWRLTGVASTDDLAGLVGDVEKLAAAASLYRLIKRLVAGEEPQPGLFFELKAALTFMTQESLPSRSAFLVVAGLRLMHHLGYVSPSRPWQSILPPVSWQPQLLAMPPARLTTARRALAAALAASQL